MQIMLICFFHAKELYLVLEAVSCKKSMIHFLVNIKFDFVDSFVYCNYNFNTCSLWLSICDCQPGFMASTPGFQRTYFEYYSTGIDIRMILKGILRNWDIRVYKTFIMHSIGISGGLLWIRWRTSGWVKSTEFLDWVLFARYLVFTAMFLNIQISWDVSDVTDVLKRLVALLWKFCKFSRPTDTNLLEQQFVDADAVPWGCRIP